MSLVERGFLLVRTGRRRVGLDLCHVLGVTSMGTVHPVPSVEAAVRGVAMVQGGMVPVIHLGALLESSAYPPEIGDLGILVTVGGRRMCLEVDDADLAVRDRTLSVPQGNTLPWAVGVAKSADGMVPLLDLSALSSRFMETGSI